MNQLARASVIMLETSGGRMSEYLSRVDYPARDVRLAFVNAPHLKIASPKDLFMLDCCNYVPWSAKYTVAILRLLELSAVITLIGILLGFHFLTPKGRVPPNATAR